MCKTVLSWVDLLSTKAEKHGSSIASSCFFFLWRYRISWYYLCALDLYHAFITFYHYYCYYSSLGSGGSKASPVLFGGQSVVRIMSMVRKYRGCSETYMTEWTGISVHEKFPTLFPKFDCGDHAEEDTGWYTGSQWRRWWRVFLLVCTYHRQHCPLEVAYVVARFQLFNMSLVLEDLFAVMVRWVGG